ncbi:IMS domain-containing protein [Prochlorococcus sp. MIT 1307]|uniref:IMS domain-containing protein n=1 Tax=Prochlorococcus sp. MIT 1307 TaxID=3096219 RepID=UPI002A75321C|nr:IMS domain-containing protein [Prochlorococcus sp. MIT 1307]
MPIAAQRVELPIDHFRLLGVSPSAQAEAVLRSFQLRLDRSPDQGFTHEVLLQRAELLRLSADLLTDGSLREGYEAALLGGASGLEFSSNREVAGLILLWEAGSSVEAFNLARKALQPPQAPALGSGREADLTLVAALSCQAAALQEQEQRHYQSSAEILQEGIQLLQRMGKLPEHRKTLEKDLEALLPYRILDLVSRDLGDQEFHQEGLQLLDGFVRQRGGIEGSSSSIASEGLQQSDFVLFFQQIRKFLTAQEQLDLFIRWQKRGSAEAGFLGVMALVAVGFSQRKPERLQQARKYLKSLDLPGLDKFPLIGCMDLLLADVSEAEERFRNSSDEGLKSWLESYPGETLAALCDYCRDWLRSDVLPGYRDVEAEPVDLEAWFADRDVQAYVESIERKGALGLAKSSFSFLSSLSGEKVQTDPTEKEIDVNTDLPMPGGLPDYDEESAKLSGTKRRRLFKSQLKNLSASLKLLEKNPIRAFFSNSRSACIGASLAVALIAIGTSLKLFNLRTIPSTETSENKQLLLKDSNELTSNLNSSLKEPEIEPLTIKEPSSKEVQALIEVWLSGKARVLSGSSSKSLPIVARKSLVERVQLERDKDEAKEESQIINATITSFKLVSQTPKRIEAKVNLSYTDQRIKSSGEIVSETTIPSLNVTYILGREKELWQLVAYLSGN